ncbi:FAD-binding oxidoreductase [Domibacillus sp. A3M-37]|uniref:FAD-binding oxidoreductase n=1 Tax=Domibacillus sp. A3M-37 TaxID=2962037 RepID=UPI0020B7B615|nr:FAD-binding oxidoreductase [Domibacillus sp. A3M-37]MCP3760946.1 FAD-binding oxidoreductase [Domibacillus sp. A3M-37]
MSEKLRQAVSGEAFITDEAVIARLSKDYYWYSPVLEKELAGKRADYVIVPETEEELRRALQAAASEKIPVTIRGGGTGNYGQAVPMTGGLVVDLSRLTEILEIGDGFVRVQAGARLRDIEKAIHETGQELKIYPSTFVKATVGGFVSGGSGGVGSVTWGNLWDGNVISAKIMTIEASIRELTVSGDELQHYIHSYGTIGIMTEVTIPITPKSRWVQQIYAFTDFSEALHFSRAVAEEEKWKKRLVSVMEAPISDFFKPLKKHIGASDRALVLLEIDESNQALLEQEADRFHGKAIYTISADQYRKGIGLSDFTWNHTTLWALKADKQWTYLQNFFSIDNLYKQVKEIKSRFGADVLLHFEWLRDKGRLVPAALPLVKFESKKQLDEVIHFFNEIGASTSDPHTYLLGAGGWDMQMDAIAQKKKENDPFGLLNQAKIPNKEHIQGLNV